MTTLSLHHPHGKPDMLHRLFSPWALKSLMIATIVIGLSISFMVLQGADLLQAQSPRTTQKIDRAAAASESPVSQSAFVTTLTQEGLDPKIIQTLHRPPFSADGMLVAFDGDNVQVFSYTDHESAVREGTAFLASLSGRAALTTHIYVQGNEVIFYMGEKQHIAARFDPMEELTLSARPLPIQNPE